MGCPGSKQETEGATSPRSMAYKHDPESAQPSSPHAAVGKGPQDGEKKKKGKTKKNKKETKYTKQVNTDEASRSQGVQKNDRHAQYGCEEERAGKHRDRQVQDVHLERNAEHADRIQTNSGGIESSDTNRNESERKKKEEEIKSLESVISEKNAQLQQMRRDLDMKDKKIAKLNDQEKRRLELQGKMQGDDTNKMKKLLDGKEIEIKKTKKELSDQVNRFEQMAAHARQQAKELDWLNDDIAKKEDSYKKQIETLKEEKDSLLLRLSAIAGAKLTDANPDLADLSDENRPTKLAEKYSELYDNEWTEGFEYLNKNMGYDEQKCTKKLLDILQICYDDCRRKADKDLEDLLRLATDNFCKGDALPVEMKKTLKDNRKKYHSEIPKDLCQEIDKHLESSPGYLKSDALAPYVSKCHSICWLMAIQDPPVAIERPENLQPGRKFDKNFYRYYTSSGDHIDFFVWPTLYIQDGGPVLCKGVAQGDKGSVKSHGIETSGPQNSATSPGPQDLLTSSKKQGSEAYLRPHDLATSKKQGLATPYKELDSKASSTPQNVATSKPQSSAASPRKPDMTTSMSQQHRPLSQNIDYTTPKPSKGDPTQGTRPQSQQSMMKTLTKNVKSGRPVGPAPTVNSTGSVGAKQYSSTINVKL